MVVAVGEWVGGQVSSELLLEVQNLQRMIEEVVVGKTNTKTLSKGKGGNSQHSELIDMLTHKCCE